MLYSKKTLLLSMLTVSSFPVVANTIPNAGLLLQQQSLQPYQPQAEVSIEVPEQIQMAHTDLQQQIKVEKISITGNQSIQTKDLQPLFENVEGTVQTFSDLQSLVKKITTYYQQQGYPYSRAYLPVQNLTDGVVTIAIMEAKYDRIRIQNQTDTSTKLIESILAPLQSGNIIDSATLQQQLKLLNRLGRVIN